MASAFAKNDAGARGDLVECTAIRCKFEGTPHSWTDPDGGFFTWFGSQVTMGYITYIKSGLG
jgi:hypothetical protein